jgi:heptosyltransferase-1
LKVLILKPSSLGDVIHALPVLRLLRRHLPHAEVHWWIDRRLAPLLDGDPDLASIIPFDRKGWLSLASWRRLLDTIHGLRNQQFDWVIDLQGLARSAGMAWLANGKLTVGLDTTREGARGFYDLAVRRASWDTHAVDWYLAVLARLGVPVDREFSWMPPRQEAWEKIRACWPVDARRWILLQPGARWQNKRWPAPHFVALAKQLSQSHPEYHFAVMGGGEDKPLGAEISGSLPGRCLDLTGALSLPEMVEWIRAGELMVTNDTGPMHVAAALGKPLVALFGPTEPARTGPYGQVRNALQLRLPCVPCMRQHCWNPERMECLEKLAPALVAQTVAQLLPGSKPCRAEASA